MAAKGPKTGKAGKNRGAETPFGSLIGMKLTIMNMSIANDIAISARLKSSALKFLWSRFLPKYLFLKHINTPIEVGKLTISVAI